MTDIRRAPSPGRLDSRRCRWCGRRFEVVPGRGRPRTFCRQSCRQRDYEARRRSAAAGLGDGDVIISRAELDALHDRLYELEAAVEDVDNDLADGRPDAGDYRRALEWLLTAARPVIATRLGSETD